jgi:predicted lipid-binding transport protein (Tim44 family)
MGFMNGLFNFVAAVLNALFRSSETRVRQSIWSFGTADDPAPSMASMTVITVPASGSAPPAPVQQATPAQRVRDEIAALQQIDPDFNDLQFLAQATPQYNAVLAAENAMNAAGLSGIATPSFIDWLKKSIADWNADGLRRVVKDVNALAPAIIRVTLDGVNQAILVRFSGTAVRCTQDITSGTAVDGSLQSDSFTEFATFVRPAGTTTPKSAGQGGATHCPACGAPTVAGAATCPFCGTQLTGTGSLWLIDHLSESAYT